MEESGKGKDCTERLSLGCLHTEENCLFVVVQILTHLWARGCFQIFLKIGREVDVLMAREALRLFKIKGAYSILILCFAVRVCSRSSLLALEL